MMITWWLHDDDDDYDYNNDSNNAHDNVYYEYEADDINYSINYIRLFLIQIQNMYFSLQ